MKHIGRIKIFQEADNLMDNICICPHCGRHSLYGNMMMYNGIHGCPICYESLRSEIIHTQSANYDLYLKKANNHEWESYRWKEGD